MDDNLDELLEEEDEIGSPRRRDRRQSSGSEKSSLSHFGPRQGRLLSRLLTHTHLPGLSSLDQMHLLALADTVSTCNTDFAERFAVDSAKNPIGKEASDGMLEGEVSSGMYCPKTPIPIESTPIYWFAKWFSFLYRFFGRLWSKIPIGDETL